MGSTSELKVGGTVIWYDAGVLDSMEPRLFEPDWLRDKGSLRGSAQGRNEAYFLHYLGRDMVLRHFRRGGLFGKLNRDRYICTDIGKGRAMREFMLLAWMRRQSLPVPRPIAARHCPSGLFYRADLITERVPEARPLAEVLQERALPERNWTAIGSVIRQLHGLGVHHADLNCRNILLDACEQAWLIDFDKCERREPNGWMMRNLARLRRSFEKEKQRQKRFNWAADDWSALLSGYMMGGEPQERPH
ncbi:MAG: 3-deoxy-D-manno-octulosonic acid kinase [Boseongicola sp. SB0662_bin_57]|nr:3-deoxy-D-manno-octulosonic acid kinase [Boseongicola sp. SB0662_bin_57]